MGLAAQEQNGNKNGDENTAGYLHDLIY